MIEGVEALPQKVEHTKYILATHVGMPENAALNSHFGWSEVKRNGNKILMNKAP